MKKICPLAAEGKAEYAYSIRLSSSLYWPQESRRPSISHLYTRAYNKKPSSPKYSLTKILKMKNNVIVFNILVIS